MADSRGRLRAALWVLHRWIGTALFVLIAPIALSGALLVLDNEFDAALNPARYAVSGNTLLAPSAYLASAGAALGDDMRPANLRYPEYDGAPVTVQARGPRVEGAPPRLLIVYLDPPTARVLDVVDYRSSLIGILHRFHENLTIPDYSGRAIVGWVGVGLATLALSGIVLWWPRNVSLLRGLRFQRRPEVISNLHFVFGFWISLPLAFVALTGIYLAFPSQARTLMSSVVATAPAPSRDFSPPVRQTATSADRVVDIASNVASSARPVALFLPSSARSPDVQPAWRVQLRTQDGDIVTAFVEDRSGLVRLQEAPLAGDRAAQWVRWLHEGSKGGWLWRLIVLLTGLMPPVLGITGIVMWLRRRRNRSIAASARAGALQAAE